MVIGIGSPPRLHFGENSSAGLVEVTKWGLPQIKGLNASGKSWNVSLQCLLLYYKHHLWFIDSDYIRVWMISLCSPTLSCVLHTAPSSSITSHQILKLYAWEPSFQAQVEGIRGQELKVMRKFAYLTSVSTFIFSCAPALVSPVSEPHKKTLSSRSYMLFVNVLF